MTAPRRLATSLDPPLPHLGHVPLDEVRFVEGGRVRQPPVVLQEAADTLLVVVHDVARDTPSERQQLVVRHDVIHEAEAERLVRGHEVAGERHLDRASETDRLREQHGDAASRHDADARVGVGEPRAVRRDEEGALQRELEPTGHRDAVDRADDGLRDFGEEPVEPIGVALGTFARRAILRRAGELAGDLLQVDPGRERRIGAGQDHRVDVGIVAAASTASHNAKVRRAAERVPRVGAIEGQRRDAIFDLDQEDGCGLRHCDLRSDTPAGRHYGTGQATAPGAPRWWYRPRPWTSAVYHRTETLTIDASADDIYELLTDVSAMGRWSPVCTGGQYDADDATWFTGDNAIGEFTWSTRCRVEVAEPGREFTFVNCGQEGEHEIVRWGFTLRAAGDGQTEVTQTWEVLPRTSRASSTRAKSPATSRNASTA